MKFLRSILPVILSRFVGYFLPILSWASFANTTLNVMQQLASNEDHLAS